MAIKSSTLMVKVKKPYITSSGAHEYDIHDMSIITYMIDFDPLVSSTCTNKM